MARMCMYCETDGNYHYKCKSPASMDANWRLKSWREEFKRYCSKADDGGCAAECPHFVTMESGPSVQADGKDSRPRGRERLTYLKRMKSEKPEESDGLPEQAASAGSSVFGNALKAGVKAAIDIGKNAVNPAGAGVNFLADAAKKLVDEL